MLISVLPAPTGTTVVQRPFTVWVAVICVQTEVLLIFRRRLDRRCAANVQRVCDRMEPAAWHVAPLLLDQAALRFWTHLNYLITGLERVRFCGCY